MPKYDRGTEDPVDVPTGLGDPNPAFFDSRGAGANCYAYAINVFRSDAPSINPGEIGGGEVASYSDSDTDYQKACESDGLIHVGASTVGYVNKSGGFLVAFFKTMLDQHWRRCDTLGNWSEKLPGNHPCFCGEQQDQSQMNMKSMSFRAYYWVRPEVVKLAAKSKKKSKQCIIL